MAKNTRWDIKDFQKKGLIEVDGKFVPASSQVDPKPVKINAEDFYKRLKIPDSTQRVKDIIEASKQDVGNVFHYTDTYPVGIRIKTIQLTVDRRDMEQVAKEYLANLGQKATKKAVAEAIKQIRIQEAEDFLMHHRGANCFYIPGTVRSSKNSKQIFKKKGKDGAGDRMFIGKSFAAIKHEKSAIWHYNTSASRFKEYVRELPLPYFIKFTVIAENDARFDFHNIFQLPADMMQAAEWIPDDSRHYIVPIPNPITYIHPEKAGILIEVL